MTIIFLPEGLVLKQRMFLRSTGSKITTKFKPFKPLPMVGCFKKCPLRSDENIAGQSTSLFESIAIMFHGLTANKK